MHRFVTLHLIIVYVCIILGSVASFQPPFAVTSRTKPSSASISIARLQQSDRFDVVEDRFGIRAQQHVSKWPALLNKRNWSLQKVRSYLWSHRRRILACSLALILCLALSQSAFAVTGGRMGGSFSRSGSGASMGRSYLPPSSYRGNPFSNSRAVFGSPASSTRLYSSQLKSHVATKFTALDAALWTGTGALLSYGAYNNYKKRDGTSPLGPGGTVASITLSLDVSDPSDSGSIVQRLRRISDQANTSTRQGVQDLVMDVCMEISRQERSIVSAATDFQHHGTVALAQREFQRHSVRNRSKFDRDGVNKFGSDNLTEGRRLKIDRGQEASPTAAVVSINIAIEGDTTKLSSIRGRKDLVSALSKLASDVQVEDCLLSAEILWAPDAPGEVLTVEDVYADYPDLFPL